MSPGSERIPVVSTHPVRSSLRTRTPYELEAFGLTDVGRVRELNEDYFALRPGLGLFTVADGMGGHAAGEVASRLALEGVCHAVEKPTEVWPPNCHPHSRHPSAVLLVEALQVANRRLMLEAYQDPSRTGMGTTFVGALFTPGRVAIAHVGDSRAYRLRGRTLTQLTEDHSLQNEHIRMGLFDPDAGHPFSHPSVITRAVGLDLLMEVDVRIDAPEVGDIYLLCSDGLTGLVSAAELTGILLMERDLGRAARELVRRANELGGHDNITAVLVRVTEPRVGAARTARWN